MAGRLRKYLIFTRSGFQTTIAYRGAIFLWFLGALINAAVMCLLWWAIYSFAPQNAIGGLTLPQMMMYMILAAIVAEVSYSTTLSEITNDVREGLIGMRLMKPVNYRAQLGFTTLGSCAARSLILGLPLTIAGTLICVYGFGLTGLTWYNLLLFVPAVLLAVLFTDTLEFVFGQLAFRTQAMFGVQTILQTLLGFLSGALIPLSLFPGWAQTALSYTPFPSMVSMPVRLFLGLMTPLETLEAFGISLLWLVALNILAHLLYKASVRHVVVFGG